MFVDDLSNWYVRRARRRFWNPAGGDGGDDARAAFHTLHTCLVTVAQLLAPFTPFLAEELWRTLAAGRSGVPASVHLSDYPVADASSFDETLNAAMAAARAIVELGRRVRVETKTRTRQPLAEAVVHYPGDHQALASVLPLVAEELNVKEVVFAESDASFGRWRAKPNYKVLGPRLGDLVKRVAGALAADDGTVASALARGETVTLIVDGQPIALTPDDVDLGQEVTEGWGVASDGGLTVALDLEVTDDLLREGQAREVVRAVQDARRAAGLDVSDRIELAVSATGDVAASIAAFRDYVSGETLAVCPERGDARRRRVPPRGGDRRWSGRDHPAEGGAPERLTTPSHRSSRPPPLATSATTGSRSPSSETTLIPSAITAMTIKANAVPKTSASPVDRSPRVTPLPRTAPGATGRRRRPILHRRPSRRRSRRPSPALPPGSATPSPVATNRDASDGVVPGARTGGMGCVASEAGAAVDGRSGAAPGVGALAVDAALGGRRRLLDGRRRRGRGLGPARLRHALHRFGVGLHERGQLLQEIPLL